VTPKPFVISIIGFGCLAAASMGGYLAARPDTAAEPVAAAAAPAPDAASAPAAAPRLERPAEPLVEPVPDPDERPDRRRLAEAPARSAVVRPSPVRTAPTASAPRQQPRLPADVLASEPPPAPAASQPATPPAEVAPVEPVGAPPARIEAARYYDVTVADESVIGIRLETALSSETAQLEDRVVARVSRDVKVDDVTAIPAGSLLEGHVTVAERGGKFKDRSRIGIRFTTLVLDDTRLPIETEAIFRDGQAPMREATTKVGASAVVGTILGAVIGGKKGAAIGGAAGAASGTAAVMAGGRNEAVIAAGTPLTVRLTEPLVVSLKRE
jgi:hypothetical protein